MFAAYGWLLSTIKAPDAAAAQYRPGGGCRKTRLCATVVWGMGQSAKVVFRPVWLIIVPPEQGFYG